MGFDDVADPNPGLIVQLVSGIRIVRRDGAPSITVDPAVAALIDAHSELLGLEIDALLARLEAETEDTAERMQLGAARQVLGLCRQHGSAAPLRATAANSAPDEASDILSGPSVATFLSVSGMLERRFAKGGLLRASLAVARGAALDSLMTHRPAEREAFREAALEAYSSGLDVLRAPPFGADIATALNDAGVLWAERRAGDRAANIETAIACFEDALTVFTRKADRRNWAMTRNNLGNAYSDRLRGKPADNVEQAISCYQDASSVITRRAAPQEWAATRSNLGSAYLSRQKDDHAQNLERAIRCFKDALTVHQRDADRLGWAQTQSNLGAAYRRRPRGNRAQNLERAIACLDDALSVLTREEAPEDWATAKNNLGVAFRHRVHGDRAENLEQAIGCFEAVLTARTPAGDPHNWAMTRSNLGNAFSDRVHGDRAENLERAIACFEDALTVRTRKAAPREWAATCNNLGAAYAERLYGDRVANLEQAIACYTNALTVRTRKAAPREWAETRNNLGSAYSERLEGDREHDVERAIACYKAALTVLTRKAAPREWAAICNNLGNAYADRLRGDPAKNIERAIACYREALTFRTRRADPFEWAQTRTNLGVAYGERRTGRRGTNLRQAVACFREALPILTPLDPSWALGSRTALGGALLELGKVDDALATWREAMERRAALLRLGPSFETRAQARRRGGDLVYRLALLELSRGEVSAAVATLERGRALSLREALALDDAWLAAVPEASRALVSAARQRLSTLRTMPPRSRHGLDPAQIRTWEHDVSAAEKALDATLATAGYAVPPPLDGSAIAASAPDGGALVLLVSGTAKGAAIVLPSGCGEPAAEHVVDLPRATAAALNRKLVGWLDTCGKIPRAAANVPDLIASLRPLNVVLEAMLGELWDMVMAPILSKADNFGLALGSELILLPQGDLALLPLHAAGRGTGITRHAVIDDHVVSYVPSAAALRTARERLTHRQANGLIDASGRGRGLFAVFNPMKGAEGQLPLAEAIEMPALSDLFLRLHHAVRCCVGQDETSLAAPAATVTRVLDEAPASGYVHLACHGSFDHFRPERSGLQLAGGEFLSVQAIVRQLALPASRWVALSACETGMVDIRFLADEFVGLPASFLQAGAPGVVAALWSVYDQPTVQLMPKLYEEHLVRGLAPAAALREAVRWLRGMRSAASDMPWRAPPTAMGIVISPDLPTPPARSPDEVLIDLFELPIIWAAYSYHGV